MSPGEGPADLAAHVGGALLGLAAGDAAGCSLARRPPDAAILVAEEVGPHAATTTWALAVVDSFLYRSPATALLDDLALRLRILAAPFRGRALRGRQQGFAGTLAQVAAALEREEDPRVCGVDDVLADGVAAAVPLALALSDPEEEIAAALVDIVTLTHRNARVVGAAGAFVFGVRSWITKGDAPVSAHLEAARAGSVHALAAFTSLRRGHTKGSPTEATGALAIALAAGAGGDPAALLAPPGYDGRDAPERLVVAALLAPALSPAALTALVAERRAAGGDADVTLPLLLACRGAARGGGALPLAMTTRLSTRAAVERRAAALLDPAMPALLPLVEEELLISLGRETEDEQAARDGSGATAAKPVRAAPAGRARKRGNRDQIRLL